MPISSLTKGREFRNAVPLTMLSCRGFNSVSFPAVHTAPGLPTRRRRHQVQAHRRALIHVIAQVVFNHRLLARLSLGDTAAWGLCGISPPRTRPATHSRPCQDPSKSLTRERRKVAPRAWFAYLRTCNTSPAWRPRLRIASYSVRDANVDATTARESPRLGKATTSLPSLIKASPSTNAPRLFGAHLSTTLETVAGI